MGEGLLDWGRETFGLTINEFYGQTECNLVLSQLRRPDAGQVPGAMGRAGAGPRGGGGRRGGPCLCRKDQAGIVAVQAARTR